MTVKHALLAVLTLGPAYGLQLRDELVTRAPHRAGINVGQVYGTLDRLQRAGLTTSAGTSTDGLPLYELTDAGLLEARTWLRAPAASETLDWSEMLDQVLVSSSIDEAGSLELITRYRDDLSSTASRADAGGEEPAPSVQASAAADAVARAAAAALAWLDGVRAEFAVRTPEVPVSRSRPRRGRRPAGAV